MITLLLIIAAVALVIGLTELGFGFLKLVATMLRVLVRTAWSLLRRLGPVTFALVVAGGLILAVFTLAPFTVCALIVLLFLCGWVAQRKPADGAPQWRQARVRQESPRGFHSQTRHAMARMDARMRAIETRLARDAENNRNLGGI